jgi:hypothetical protein
MGLFEEFAGVVAGVVASRQKEEPQSLRYRDELVGKVADGKGTEEASLTILSGHFRMPRKSNNLLGAVRDINSWTALRIFR